MSDDIFPPRKRNWKRGTVQYGVFVRTENGTTIRLVCNSATVAAVEALYRFLHGEYALADATAAKEVTQEHCLRPDTCNPEKGANGCICKCAGCQRER